jgi:hypothetical protein
LPHGAITAETRGEVILRFRLEDLVRGPIEGRSQAVPALVGGASADPVTRRRATVRPLFNDDRGAVIEPLQGEVSA